VFESCVYEFFFFVFVVGYFAYPFVVYLLEYGGFYVYVDYCAVDAFVSEYLFDVHYAFCFVVFHCSFPVSEGVEVDLEEFWVVEFFGGSVS